MPRIEPNILNCVFYLYRTVADAKGGFDSGGCGFIVRLNSSVPTRGFWHTYAVTNSHVVREGQSSVVRLNTPDGGVAVIELDPSDWLHHPNGDDLAACQIDVTKYGDIGIDWNQWEHQREGVIFPFPGSVGEDVFMVSRFVYHDGKQQNQPVVRFGNIARMEGDPIDQPGRGLAQETYFVEMRSISGHSGSPVFLLRNVLPVLPHEGKEQPRQRGELLGVNWCHLDNHQRVLDENKDPLPERLWVNTNSGMAGVIPAHKLQSLLMDKGFVRAREEDDEAERMRLEAGGILPAAGGKKHKPS